MTDKAEILAALRAQMAHVEATAGQGSETPSDDGKPRRSLRRGPLLDADSDNKGRAHCYGSNDDGSDMEEHGDSLRAIGDASSKRISSKQVDTSEEGAFKRMVDLISHTMRTERELRQRLRKEGFPEASIAPAIQRAKACGLVNDEIYAEQFTLARRERNMGFDRIKRDLAIKGIDPTGYAFWQELKEESSPEGEFAEALGYASRHLPSSKHPGRSLYASLMRRGYAASIASRVVRELGYSLYE